MSAAAAKRRRRQFKIGHRHLARICGKHVKGGRPIYKGGTSLSVADAIQRERMQAQAEMRRKQKKK